WQLTHILNTHHHWDHTGGNLALKKATGCTVIGPHSEAGRIPGLDTAVADGDVIEFGGHRIEVLETSGHTSGHVVYYLPEEKLAFVGDTLFAMGCGRLFEGSAEQMWHSLQKIMAWPDDTRLYCAHEYTEANASFALTVEPENTELQHRAKEVRGLRAENQPTIPTTLIREKATNPFLRVDSPAIRSRLEMKNARPEEVFARIRALKDNF
ncbi:MAG: hydroxyacylglutathione hydrolase, partial [Gammaproteobacteria bacterium]